MASKKDLANIFGQAFSQKASDATSTMPAFNMSSLISQAVQQPVNQYDMSSLSPGLASAMAYQQTQQGIQQAAASRVPDMATLTEALLDRDIYGGHKGALQKNLQAMSKLYLDQYAKDPYFAFSR